MISISEIENLIKKAIPDAKLRVTDLTGGDDHFSVAIASAQFEGKTLLDQHRLVQDALNDALNNGNIHALQIKTVSLNSWKEQPPKAGNDLNVI